jgi:hypothetical protein
MASAPHICHARGCSTPIEPFRLMCGPHWKRVPPELQTAVWAAYRHGQETDKDPSPAYLAAAELAIAAVARTDDGQTKFPGF